MSKQARSTSNAISFIINWYNMYFSFYLLIFRRFIVRFYQKSAFFWKMAIISGCYICARAARARRAAEPEAAVSSEHALLEGARTDVAALLQRAASDTRHDATTRRNP